MAHAQVAKNDPSTSTSQPSSPSKSVQGKGKQGITSKFILNPIFKDPKLRAELIANMKSQHHALRETPEGRREIENYTLVKGADDLLKVGRVAEASAMYKKVLAENDGKMVTAGAIAGLAEVALRSGDKATALGLYRDLVYGKEGRSWVTSRSNDPVVRMKLALLSREAGRPDEAWEHFQFAMKLAPTTGVALPPTITRNDVSSAQFALVANLMIAKRLKDFDAVQAVAFARDAVRANPTNGLPHYYLGEMLYKEDEVEAKAEFEKAVRYGHGDYVKRAEEYLYQWKMNGGPKAKAAVQPAPNVPVEAGVVSP